jgi:hypothetical protein
VAPNVNMVDQTFLAHNVATHSAEGLGECSHQGVDRSGVNTEVIGDTASVRSQGTNGVSLINEEIELGPGSAADQSDEQWSYLVLLLELKDPG